MSKYQRRFRKDHNSQHCLITLIEKWKKSVDNVGAFGALVTDLSKAFGCLSRELLIAKLDEYGFDKRYLKLIYTYLSNRKERVKINGKYSSWNEILLKFHKGQFYGLCCSIFSYAIWFVSLKTLMLQVMRTTLHHIVRIKVPSLLSVIQNNHQQFSLTVAT